MRDNGAAGIVKVITNQIGKNDKWESEYGHLVLDAKIWKEEQNNKDAEEIIKLNY